MLWRNVVAALTTRGAGSIVLVGLEWPAKAFKTDFDTASLQVQKSGGTLSASPPAGVPRRDLTDAELRVAIDEFEKYLEGDGQAVVAAAKGILVGGALDPNKAAALFAASSRLLGAADTEIQEDTKPLGAAEPHQRLLALARPPALKAQPGLGAAQSLRSVVGEVFAGPRAAIARFLSTSSLTLR
jgi:hypothetical protein